ncbi:lebercilin isoform X2 [Brienomyrus brachyistius]|uniref:lebercilin isoform X2 n=1 Tax=Brienomyrus brachyistius TaxID=42636 RepID=UPI0020B2D3F6|nr:lebercilin isoform X2 [Brienomyrus brachyistius]
MHQSNEDNLDGDRTRNSSGSMTQNSESSSKFQSGDNKKRNGKRNQARTRRRGASDGDRNSGSYYSEDYENSSASGCSLSPSSRSLSPVPRSLAPTKRVSSSPLRKPGLRKSGSRHLRPGAPLQQGGGRSQSLNKDPLPKDLDLVTKRMLSARLLKINELKNELAETQLRLQQLQQENKVLRQLQLRQERALQRFEDTESEIAQLLSRHSSEVHALRERLRRSQERERAADRRQRETQEELTRCRSALQKLRRLAEERHLGEREELARKLEQAEGRLADSDRRVKDLERNLELTSSSLQRHLTAERRKTHEALEEAKGLREELERLGHKLKEKERELDTRNIYANRMKPAHRKEAESSMKKRGPPTSATKEVQTEDRMFSLEFPTPPPAITDRNEPPQRDEYLSLKANEASDGENWHKVGREKEEVVHQEQEMENVRRLRGDKGLTPSSAVSPLTEAADSRMSMSDTWRRQGEPTLLGEDEGRKRWGHDSPRVQEKQEEEKRVRSQELLEERSRKDQLLAKMKEIDLQGRDTNTDMIVSEHKPAWTPPQYIFSLTDPGENLQDGGRESLRKSEPLGKRGLRTLDSNEDLSFGSYTPSFGRPAPRAGLVNLPGPRSDRLEERSQDNPGVAGAPAKEQKSNLMEQLFGTHAGANMPSRLEVLGFSRAPLEEGSAGKPSSTETNGKRGDFFPFSGDPSTGYGRGALQVVESRPAVRAIASFDDEIEEVTL